MSAPSNSSQNIPADFTFTLRDDIDLDKIVASLDRAEFMGIYVDGKRVWPKPAEPTANQP